MQPQDTPLTRSISTPTPPSTTLHGRWLVLARAIWIVIALLVLAIHIAATPLIIRDFRTQSIGASIVDLGFGLVVGALPWVYYAAAAIIFWRKSDNWMAIFASLALMTFGSFLATFAGSPTISTLLMLRHPELRWPFLCVRIIAWGSFLIFFLLFPNGQFVPRWTRWLAASWVAYVLSWLLFPTIDPFAGDLAILLLPGCLIAGMLAQVYRYIRVSTLTQRQQTRWVMFGCTAAGLAAILTGVSWFLLQSLGDQFWLLVVTTLLISIFPVPISIAIAILRSRLWDVDTVIRRTLIYSTLTLILGLIYIGAIVLSRALIAPVVGSSEITIVASTLAIAALFTPLRRGVQRTIDRRFYRRKYDAAKVLARFGATVRDETDLERLTAEMLHVVDETMQPAFVSLWLRDPQAHSTSESALPGSTRPH